MSFARFHNIGSQIAAVDSGVAFNTVAGGAADNVEQVGAIIDRTQHGAALSASLLIPYRANLAAGQSLKIGYRVEHGADAALADTSDFVKVLPAANQVANSVAGGVVTGVVKVDLDLAGAKRYIRVDVTSDLSAAGVDTSVLSVALVLGGEDRVPSI